MCCTGETEDQVHAFLKCPGNNGVGRIVLESITELVDFEEEQIVKLQFSADEGLELPVVWFLAVSWISIWESRALGKRPELYQVRADLEAQVCLLRETRRYETEANVITSIINNFYT